MSSYYHWFSHLTILCYQLAVPGYVLIIYVLRCTYCRRLRLAFFSHLFLLETCANLKTYEKYLEQDYSSLFVSLSIDPSSMTYTSRPNNRSAQDNSPRSSHHVSL
jgi:hypothetical protein